MTTCVVSLAIAADDVAPHAVPGAKALAESRKLIKEIFAEEYAAADSREEKLALAKKLWELQ